ncbi:hypothetical protein K2Y00_02985 [Patescibacteria group bacterium]|nr:hypothetical protein [Patescibacteria group bacterium]
MKLKLPFKVPSLKYGDRIHAVRDWLALLSALLIFLVASVAWNAWFFVNVTDESAFITPGQSAPAPILSALPAAREVLENRAGEADRYRIFYQFVDPS